MTLSVETIVALLALVFALPQTLMLIWTIRKRRPRGKINFHDGISRTPQINGSEWQEIT